jgi:2-oxoisovalerate dehydrogenase E2 component (dihydrolipoyl transacylase)
MSRFVLPDLGEGLKEAEIVEWHVAEGDHVVADQPLLAVETEKAVVEVPSPRAGRISRLLAKLGDRVPVGAPLVEFEEGPHPDSGTVVGDLKPAPASAPSRPSPTKAPPVSIPTVKATPAVRALAVAQNVDLSQIRGMGPDGTITRDDVMRAATPAAGAAQGEPLRGVRLSMARNMVQARQSIVPATLFDDADIESWYEPKADVTLRLIRAIAAGCAAEPGLNCWFDEAHMTREVKAEIDLGIAMDTEAGLIVPVLRDAGRSDVTILRQSLDMLKAAVRTRSVGPAQLRGATITLSNFGVIGGRYAALALLPPQVAIVGAGRIERRAISEAQATGFHAQLPLSLTFDHRVITGGEAARFMNAMIGDLQRAS